MKAPRLPLFRKLYRMDLAVVVLVIAMMGGGILAQRYLDEQSMAPVADEPVVWDERQGRDGVGVRFAVEHPSPCQILASQSEEVLPPLDLAGFATGAIDVFVDPNRWHGLSYPARRRFAAAAKVCHTDAKLIRIRDWLTGERLATLRPLLGYSEAD